MQFSFNELEWLKSAGYYWTKTSIIDTFSGSALKVKDVLKFRKFPKSFAKLSLL